MNSIEALELTFATGAKIRSNRWDEGVYIYYDNKKDSIVHSSGKVAGWDPMSGVSVDCWEVYKPKQETPIAEIRDIPLRFKDAVTLAKELGYVIRSEHWSKHEYAYYNHSLKCVQCVGDSHNAMLPAIDDIWYACKPAKKVWRVKTIKELLESGWSWDKDGDLKNPTPLRPYFSSSILRDLKRSDLMSAYCGGSIPYDGSDKFIWNDWVWTREMLVEEEVEEV